MGVTEEIVSGSPAGSTTGALLIFSVRENMFMIHDISDNLIDDPGNPARIIPLLSKKMVIYYISTGNQTGRVCRQIGYGLANQVMFRNTFIKRDESEKLYPDSFRRLREYIFFAPYPVKYYTEIAALHYLVGLYHLLYHLSGFNPP